MAAGAAVSISLLRATLRYFTGWRCFEELRLSPYGVSLPKILHKTLNENEHLFGRKLLVVGDVHGCFDELEELLDKAGGRSDNVCVIFVGDLVNKGPKNAEVVKLAHQIRSFCVRGNHDEVCMKEWEKSIKEHRPLPPNFEWMKDLTKEEMKWFFDLPYSLHLPSRNIITVHAGIVPGVSLNEQNLENLVTMRNVYYDSEEKCWKGTSKTSRGEPWVNQWAGPEHIYFGHDAVRKLQLSPKATGLDTACVYGGELTAVFPHSGEQVVVPAKCVYKDPFKS